MHRRPCIALVALLLSAAYLHDDAHAASKLERAVLVKQLPPDEAAPSVDIFYRALAPHGVWLTDRRWGRVWAPFARGFQPYHDGHWQLTSHGFAWVSPEPFAWAVYHYGRWFFKDGRWLWQPDNAWAPAWVSWRESERYLGWAPAPPESSMFVPEERWHFVAASQILRVDLTKLYASVDQGQAYASSRPLERMIRTPKGEVFPGGPDPMRLRAIYGVGNRPRPMPPRSAGRYKAADWRDPGLMEKSRFTERVERRAH